MALDPRLLELDPDHPLRRARPRALVAGLVALALCGIGALFDPQQFLRSYLVGWLLWFGIALGCLAVLMIHHVAGGAWGASVRRVLESAAGTVPLLGLLFLPIVLGVHRLYEWAEPGVLEQDAVLRGKSHYLNVPFFVSRAILYFAVWTVVALFLNRWSEDQDRTGDAAITRRLELLSRGGLVVYGLTVTFAAIDWAMSLEPHWFSTIYGLLLMGGQGVAAFAFTIAMSAVLIRQASIGRVIGPSQFHDLGSLLLAFVMIWAYLAVSQLLIVWSGNLPEEISWYLKRTQHGWLWVGYLIIVAHFVLPFLALLSRRLKRHVETLAIVACWLVVARWVDLYWLVQPSFRGDGPLPHWMDLLTPIGVGGVWLWLFLGRLASRPVIAIGDPMLPEVEA
ncbi:MAG TPA: hypothetical protein VFD92_14210 [Candidatus Binatia bacterium]|nr:hypothetical protein [Candidatus Binatia bacterium]